jgi:hypothetical protein
MTPNDSLRDRAVSATQPSAEAGEAGTYLYEPAGIRERSGHIPLWLKVVAVSLILWGIYYAILHWSSWSSA